MKSTSRDYEKKLWHFNAKASSVLGRNSLKFNQIRKLCSSSDGRVLHQTLFLIFMTRHCSTPGNYKAININLLRHWLRQQNYNNVNVAFWVAYCYNRTMRDLLSLLSNHKNCQIFFLLVLPATKFIYHNVYKSGYLTSWTSKLQTGNKASSKHLTHKNVFVNALMCWWHEN